MKKTILILLISIISFTSFSQIKVKTYSEQIENGYEFYADNNEVCEVSIKVNFKVKNLTSSAGLEKIFVLPPNSKRNRLSTLKTIKKSFKKTSDWRSIHFYKIYALTFLRHLLGS